MKTKDFKKSCRKKLNPGDLHRELGKVLKDELRDKRIFANEHPERRLLPSNALPFLP